MRRLRFLLSALLAICLLTGCETQTMIVSNLDEREANEILVFLASKGIDAKKNPGTSSSPGAGQGSSKWTISVDKKNSTEAMAILNQNGLPRIKGVNLLELFAKQGLMSSEKEENIRYQAGLAEQIASTIRKIDGSFHHPNKIRFLVMLQILYRNILILELVGKIRIHGFRKIIIINGCDDFSIAE